jgi:hypothetical protein
VLVAGLHMPIACSTASAKITPLLRDAKIIAPALSGCVIGRQDHRSGAAVRLGRTRPLL